MKYGPEEHGNKKRLTKIHARNAHAGDVAFSITFFIAGLRANGTSITNHLPYRKKSFKLANHTRIQSVQNIILIIQTLSDVASAEKSQIHIKRYVINTARLKSIHARTAFLRL